MVKEYAVQTFSLTKIFPDWWGRAKVVAVDDLNLKINHNEVYGLLGPNGSGKTTTIKMLLSLLHPSKGKCLVLGGDSRDTKINSRIGFLPEESYLYKYLSARETLDFYGRIFGLPGKVRKERIESLLDMVGLSSVARRPVGTFSKGMARRIGLAQALINDPDLLILDEPTSGLDPLGTRQIKDLIIKLSERGKTILLCSHLLADVEDVCDRIGILYGGQMQNEGKVSELLIQSNKKRITTENLSDAAVEKIKEVAAGDGGGVEIDSPMERLESFFIDTVASAQKQSKTTSGAVSSTEIRGFLAEEKTEEILDKLVEGKGVEPVRKGPATEPVVVEERSKNELLEELTSGKTEAGTEKVKQKAVEDKVEDNGGVDKSLLDSLTKDEGEGQEEKQNE